MLEVEWEIHFKELNHMKHFGYTFRKKLADKGMEVSVSQIIHKWKDLKKGIWKWLAATKKLEMSQSVGNTMTILMMYLV